MASQPRINLAKRQIQHLEINLLDTQVRSYNEFLEKGIRAVFDEINPILDYTESSWELAFEDFYLDKPKLTFREAQNLGLSYEAPLYVNTKLLNKRTGEIKKQKLYMADVPLMGDRASFMVGGNERVVALQIIRSEGVLFLESKASRPRKPLYMVKLMPERGRWFDFEVNKYGVMSVKLLDKHPRILLTTLLRALGYSSNESITNLFSDVDNGELSFVEATLRKDPTRNSEEALLDIYRKLRPEDSITLEGAKEFLNGFFFDARRFLLGRVGRYKFNRAMHLPVTAKTEDLALKKSDIVEIIRSLIKLNNGTILPHDIDSLSNRRVRGVGEMLFEKMLLGARNMQKNIRDRMAQHSPEESLTPAQLVNTRPVSVQITQFFASSPLSRYMDQENVLSEIVYKQKITAGGPRGLTKERATFSVRDIHNSHYSRICPVHTPEGPSIGMVLHLAIYSRVNEFGFLEAPYLKVVSKFDVAKDEVAKFKNRSISADVIDTKGKVVVKAGAEITAAVVKAADQAGITHLPVRPFAQSELTYMDSDEELNHKIASANIRMDEFGSILEDKTYVRIGKGYQKVAIQQIDYIDVNTAQIGGICLSLIPFAAMDETNRTLVGAKALTQAVPLVRSQSPVVGTGFEKIAARASGRTVYADFDGVVDYADAEKVIVKYSPDSGKAYTELYEVEKFTRTNHSTSFSQRTAVYKGQKVKAGEILIEGPNTEDGELALGINLRTAYMHMDGFNYEDAIVVSERLVRDDLLTSVHIHEYTQEIRETKLGNELITSDIPNVSEFALRNLDETGVVRIGANVEPGDVLVGIIAPKGESELTAEEKLLRAIFGEYARDVRDNSLRLPHGERGVVIKIQVLDRDSGSKLNAGVLKQVKVWVASTHKISVGDKLTGFHGGKGVIGKVMPEEDMPYTADGKPVDIIFGPSSMVRRMNIGQLMETHVGYLASELGVKVEVPPFAEFSLEPLLALAKEKGVEYKEKFTLYDGRTGVAFDQPIVVGTSYFVKLEHMADFKVHARSTGPYTLVTQQPLGGRAHRGGQRFGEMEVWALEAHGAAYTLHEMLTYKSDDVAGRSTIYKAIITGQEASIPSVPESYNVFDKEMAALGIKLEKINAEEDASLSERSLEEIIDEISPEIEPVVLSAESESTIE